MHHQFGKTVDERSGRRSGKDADIDIRLFLPLAVALADDERLRDEKIGAVRQVAHRARAIDRKRRAALVVRHWRQFVPVRLDQSRQRLFVRVGVLAEGFLQILLLQIELVAQAVNEIRHPHSFGTSVPIIRIPLQDATSRR